MPPRFFPLLLLAGLAPYGAVADVPAAQAVVRDTTDRVLASVGQGTHGRERSRLYALVQEIVLPHFDFERMARRVLGGHWRKASPSQRARLLEEFRALLVRTYATALERYRDQTVNVLSAAGKEGGKRLTVRTRIDSPTGNPVAVDYRMHRSGDAWKVYDVSVAGISLVVNYRSSFASEIRRGGIDGLIARLAAHNRKAAPAVAP